MGVLHDAGQDKGNLLEALGQNNCWLQFKVKWQNWADDEHPDGTTWEDEDKLNCDELLFDFVKSVRQQKHVPFPGAVPAVAIFLLQSCGAH